ncbi:MAG: molybdopterin-dependent oxidoreductase, partial [Marinibacterium sp.]|nr:molybdopterin-dependent oxidoreductase [Marinibacterium sp.]
VECCTDGAKLPAGNRGAYAGTAAIEDIDRAERILLIGTNPRDEAPVLNARIRKAWAHGAEVALVGPAVDLTYEYHHMGDDRAALQKVVDMGGDHEIKAKRSLVIVGQGALQEADGAAVLAAAQTVASNTESGLIILHTAAARVGAMDVDATNAGGMDAISAADVIYNLGADEV